MLMPAFTTSVKLRIITSILFFLAASSSLHAQEDVIGPLEFARNSIFIELGGNGILYSLNYDRKFTDHVSGRIGGMGFAVRDDDTDKRVGVLLFPTMVNYLLGNGSSRLELGAGLLWGFAAGEVESYGSFSGLGLAGVTTTVGYRLQPAKGGFNFRIGITPLITNEGFQPWGGLGFGFGF